jgi:beta-lactamase class A
VKVPVTLALAFACVLPAHASAASDVAALESRVTAIAGRAGGDVGVGLRHLPSGETVVVRGRERFPMFSVYKLPIAMTLLARVDAGQAQLDDRVTLGPADLRPGLSTVMTSHVRDGRVTMTVRELIEAAVAASDNSASDAILRLAGGPAAVTAYVRGLGIDGLRVDRPEIQMAADLSGVILPDPSGWTVERLNALLSRAPAVPKQAATRRYLHEDPRDTTTPEAALALLGRVHARDALKRDTAAFVIDTMRKTTTGDRRIRALLPPGTVANKTGSGPATTNDVGIVTLPGSAGQFAIAVFIRDSPQEDAKRERTIAEIARAAWDHWSR